MFCIHFLSFRYKFHEDKNFSVFLVTCFVNFTRHPNPTMNVIKAVVYLVKHQTSPQQLLFPCGWEQPWKLRASRVCYLYITDPALMDDSSEDSATGQQHLLLLATVCGLSQWVVTGNIRTPPPTLFVLLSRVTLATHRPHNTLLTRWLPRVIPGQFTTRKFSFYLPLVFPVCGF